MSISDRHPELLSSLKLTDVRFKRRQLVKAAYDFIEDEDDELSFHRGDVIQVLESSEDLSGWWRGKLDGAEGWFPRNYVELHAEEIFQSLHGSEIWDRGSCLEKQNYSAIWVERLAGGKNRARAVKEIKKSLMQTKINYAKELAEMAAVSIDQKYLMPLRNWFEDDSTLYVVTEYYPLGNILDSASLITAESDVKEIARQSLEALNALYMEKLLHGNVKPENILVVAQGPKWWIKLSDYRLTRKLCPRNSGTSTDEDQPPEIPGSALCSSRIDLWYLGKILVRLVTNMRFAGGQAAASTSRSENVDLEAQLAAAGLSSSGIAVLLGLLESNPMSRWSTKRALTSAWFTATAATSSVDSKLSASAPADSGRSQSAPPLPSRHKRPSYSSQALQPTEKDDESLPSTVDDLSLDKQVTTASNASEFVHATRIATGIEVSFSGVPLDEGPDPDCATCGETRSSEEGMTMYYCGGCGGTLLHEKCARGLIDGGSGHDADHTLNKWMPSYRAEFDDYVDSLDLSSTAIEGLNPTFAEDKTFKFGLNAARSVRIHIDPPPGNFSVIVWFEVDILEVVGQLGFRKSFKLSMKSNAIGSMKFALQTTRGRNRRSVTTGAWQVPNAAEQSQHWFFEAPAAVSAGEGIEVTIEADYDKKLFPAVAPFQYRVNSILLAQMGPETKLATRQQLQEISDFRSHQAQLGHQEEIRILERQQIEARNAEEAKSAKRTRQFGIAATIAGAFANVAQ